MERAVFLTTLFCFSHFLPAQNIPDSLLQKSYKDLAIACREASTIEVKELYGKAFVKKAKKEHDPYLADGYYMLAHLYKDEKKLMYCDSIIALAERSPDVRYPGNAYLIKGNFYYKKRFFKDALDNYIYANTYATQYDNKALIFKVRYAISLLKNRIGTSEEVLQLRRENLAYARQHPKDVRKNDYLNAVFALANTFNELKIIDSAAFYEDYGIRESLRLKNRRRYYQFVMNSGLTHYYRRHYERAVDSIEKALSYFGEKHDGTSMAFGLYYLGELYFEIHDNKKAVFQLQKADSLFRQNKNLLPKIRESYTLLINHYKRENNLKQQINYMEQRTMLDSIRYHHERDLGKNIITGYDIPRLNIEKENIAFKLKASERREHRSAIIIWMVSVLLGLVFAMLMYQYRKRKLYKKQAGALISEQNVQLKYTEKNTLPKGSIGISEEIVNAILSGLEKFERKCGYLDSGISVHSLAKKIKTNANYLSKVINYHKDLSFTHYINQLRVAYAVNELKTNAVYGKFTIEAIANEFGFNTRGAFSRAFYKYTGTKPSYFIKELHKH